MARRLTPQQAQRKAKEAVRKYNSNARKVNSAIKKYNSDVKKFNREQSAQNRRLDSAIRTYNATARQASAQRTVSVELRESTQILFERYGHIEEVADEEFGELAANEAANSVEALGALEENVDAGDIDVDIRTTSINDELSTISADLDSRWRGAIYALSPQNPDAARHFCASAREVVVSMLDGGASDEVVLRDWSECEKTDAGLPTRRAKIEYLLRKRGIEEVEILSFVDSDVTDVLKLFRVFNDGTHGSAGRFDLPKLAKIKVRVEGAIRLLSYLLT